MFAFKLPSEKYQFQLTSFVLYALPVKNFASTNTLQADTRYGLKIFLVAINNIPKQILSSARD